MGGAPLSPAGTSPEGQAVHHRPSRLTSLAQQAQSSLNDSPGTYGDHSLFPRLAAKVARLLSDKAGLRGPVCEPMQGQVGVTGLLGTDKLAGHLADPEGPRRDAAWGAEGCDRERRTSRGSAFPQRGAWERTRPNSTAVPKAHTQREVCESHGHGLDRASYRLAMMY